MQRPPIVLGGEVADFSDTRRFDGLYVSTHMEVDTVAFPKRKFLSVLVALATMDEVLKQGDLVVEDEVVHKEQVDGSDVVHIKSKKEKRLVLKQDLSIVLLLAGCYWFAYLVSSATSVETVKLLSID